MRHYHRRWDWDYVLYRFTPAWAKRLRCFARQHHRYKMDSHGTCIDCGKRAPWRWGP